MKRLALDVDAYEASNKSSESPKWPYKTKLNPKEIEQRCQEFAALKTKAVQYAQTQNGNDA